MALQESARQLLRQLLLLFTVQALQFNPPATRPERSTLFRGGPEEEKEEKEEEEDEEEGEEVVVT